MERQPDRRACWAQHMAPLARAPVTEAEFLALPVTTQPMELLDGEVVMPPSPTFEHQEIVRRVVVALSRWLEQSGAVATVGVSPLDVRFGPSRVLQPEVFVILDRVAPSHVGPITRIPDSCVEVLSSDRVYDRVTKRLVYADAGVRELWTVEASGAVERWWGARLAESELVTGRLTTPLLAGFQLDVATLRVSGSGGAGDREP